MKIGAVVLAGGKGTRMHSRVQKQYRMLAGKPLILYALEAFEHSQVDHMVLVVGQGERERAYASTLSPDSRKQCTGCGAASLLKGGVCDA